MSLQSSGPSTIPNMRRERQASFRFKERGTNNISDIEGARPTQKMNRFIKKPNFTYDISDIKGSRPLALHRAVNSIDYTLKHDDIEGSRPRGVTNQNVRLNNPVDPLVPNYRLPSYELPQDAVPKFLRDTLDISDIEGTRSRPLYKFPTRENFDVNDIEGAEAGWKPRHKRVQKEGVPRNLMEVADINRQGVKKSQRCTDPLRPVHFINGMEVKDDMKYTMPKRLPPQRDGPFYPLTTRDIDGAYPGWTPPHGMQPPIEQRRHFRNTNFVGDIAGAQSDTVMHCIKTNRITNPLNPAYISLDGERMSENQGKARAALEAEASLKYAMDNSARQEAEAEAEAKAAREEESKMSYSHLSNTAEFKDIQHHQQQQPETSLAGETDEKDQRIEQLESEVARLRSGTFSNNNLAGGSDGQRPPIMTMTNGFRAPSPSSMTQYRQPSPQTAAYKAPSPALSFRSQGSNQERGGEQQIRSSRRSTPTADRMVLRSSDGKPRVKLTPREVRDAKQYAEDVAAVRDL